MMDDVPAPPHHTIHDEYLISMIDGKPYKLLLQHIKRHGYTLASYIEAFSLPLDYPMVSPASSRRRSKAKKGVPHGRHWNRSKRCYSGPDVDGQ